MTDTATEATEPTADTSRPVRVPNVTPNARSGLAGEVIGSNAVLAHDENERLAADGQPITPLPDALPDLPDGDLDARLEWAAQGEDDYTRRLRADAVWQHHIQGLNDADRADLAGRIIAVVNEPLEQPAEVAGEQVESETAGAGSAENIDTGRVTEPGEPLDAIENDDPDAVPLLPADATTVPDVLAWVNEVEGDEQRKRAQAALDAEAERKDSAGEPDPRKGVVEPLEALLSAEEPAGD